MIVVKPTIYIETTVVSYLTAKTTRDLVTAGHRQVTIEWWERDLPKFEPRISLVVLDEAARGDADAARRRLEKLTGIPLLEVAPEARQLADEYFAELRLPEQARPDTLHVGIASWEGVDYLVSWNMRHIANGRVMKLVREINDRHGIETPIICTPEELQEFSND